jgi:hypothetical protein
MQEHWINKGSSTLLLFFSGWGMDESPTLHLDPGDRDLCTCFDYQTRKVPESCIHRWCTYPEIVLAGWSLGVWAAQDILRDQADVCSRIVRSVAINGTLSPVDDMEGIPRNVFQGTLEGLNEASLDKFFRRMTGSAQDYEAFVLRAPRRSLQDVKEELSALLAGVDDSKASGIMDTSTSLIWDEAWIGNRDRIFPPDNMRRYWDGRTRVRELDLPHYPFGAFDHWRNILGA